MGNYRTQVAAGILPAVEGGFQPPGKHSRVCHMLSVIRQLSDQAAPQTRRHIGATCDANRFRVEPVIRRSDCCFVTGGTPVLPGRSGAQLPVAPGREPHLFAKLAREIVTVLKP